MHLIVILFSIYLLIPNLILNWLIMYQLDRTDFEILKLLSKDARITNKDLAGKLGIAPSTCLERVRLLNVKRILKGYYAEVDISALGATIHAMVTIRLEAHSKEIFQSFYKHALQLPEVVSVYHLSGANDFMVRVATRDTAHLKDFVLNAFAERPEVAHIETSLIYEQTQKHQIFDEPYIELKE